MPFLTNLLTRGCGLCLQSTASQALCSDCQTAAKPPSRLCIRCAIPLLQSSDPRNSLCDNCRSHPPAFSRAFTAWLYTPPWDGLVLLFKNGLEQDLADCAAQELAEQSQHRWPDYFVAVPANSVSLRERGFSPAAEFGRALARVSGRPLFLNHVYRTPERVRQHQRTRAERESAMMASFATHSTIREHTRPHIGVVDDVLTTGSTLDAVSRLLISEHQASEISVWVMARTP